MKLIFLLFISASVFGQPKNVNSVKNTIPDTGYKKIDSLTALAAQQQYNLRIINSTLNEMTSMMRKSPNVSDEEFIIFARVLAQYIKEKNNGSKP